VSTAFRVPNIPELYGGVSEGNLTTTDPCSNWSTCRHVRRLAELQGRRRSCWLPQLGNTILTTVGGNPKLEPEDAKTMTAGVWSPMKTLTLTLDYYNIKITNAIQSVAARPSWPTCYNTPGLAHIFCSPPASPQQARPARSTSLVAAGQRGGREDLRLRSARCTSSTWPAFTTTLNAEAVAPEELPGASVPGPPPSTTPARSPVVAAATRSGVR
jgi:hypothetical protein